MIIHTADGQTIDTAIDLGPEDRHIVQKLMAWESLVKSLDEFQGIKQKALATGWNDSGPVREHPLLSAVIKDIEVRICKRLKQGS